VVHIGTNNKGKKRNEVLQAEFRELGVKLKSRSSKVVISGLLPVPCASQSRNDRTAKLNTWLEGARGKDSNFWDIGAGSWGGGTTTN